MFRNALSDTSKDDLTSPVQSSNRALRYISSTANVTEHISDDKEWESAFDSDSRMYWVNHRLKTTQWLHPFIKKHESFELCPDDQLPYGWEKLYDPKIGFYYANHLERRNQLEDPRVEWQNKRIQMLNNYIQRASNTNIQQVSESKCSDLHKSSYEVSPPEQDLPPILATMDKLYKRGSSHSVEV